MCIFTEKRKKNGSKKQLDIRYIYFRIKHKMSEREISQDSQGDRSGRGDRGLGKKVPTPLRMYSRDPIGLREGQYQYEQHHERRPRARGSSGAPHTRNA